MRITRYIDHQKQFIIDSEVPYSFNKSEYDQLFTLKADTNQKFTGFLLIGAANPTVTIQQIYRRLVEKQGSTKLDLTYAKFIFSTVLASFDLEYSCTQCFDVRCKQQTFKQMEFLWNLRQQVSGKIMPLQTAYSIIEKKYPSLKIQKQKHLKNKNLGLFFINQQLHNKIKIKSVEEKKETLKNIKKYLNKRGSTIVEYNRIAGEQKYQMQPILMLKDQIGKTMSLKQMFINKQQYPGQFPSPNQLAVKLFWELRDFKRQYGYNYPVLSPENIKYNIDTQKIELNMLQFVLYQMGVNSTIYNISHLKTQKQHIKKQFWKSFKRVNNQNTQISDDEVMWEFMVLVDYFQNRGYSYFSRIKTKKQLLKNIVKFDKIVEQNKQKQYFGSFLCSVIDWYRNIGRKQWKDQNKRPQFHTLQQYFKVKQEKRIININILKCLKQSIQQKGVMQRSQRYRILDLLSSVYLLLDGQHQSKQQKQEQSKNISNKMKYIKIEGQVNDLNKVLKKIQSIWVNVNKHEKSQYFDRNIILSVILEQKSPNRMKKMELNTQIC